MPSKNNFEKMSIFFERSMKFPTPLFLIEEHYPWYWSRDSFGTDLQRIIEDQLRDDAQVGPARWFVAGRWFRSVSRNVPT